MTLRYTRKSNRTKKIEARGEKNAHSTHKVDTTDNDIHPAELKRNLVEKKAKLTSGRARLETMSTTRDDTIRVWAAVDNEKKAQRNRNPYTNAKVLTKKRAYMDHDRIRSTRI